MVLTLSSRDSTSKDPYEASVNVCFQVVIFEQLSIYIPAALPTLRYDSHSSHIQNVHKFKYTWPHTCTEKLAEIRFD